MARTKQVKVAVHTAPTLSYFSKCNMYRIQQLYVKWFVFRNMTDLNVMATQLSAYVGYIWRRGWGRKPIDPDLLDPVTYKLIMLFHNDRPPFHRKALSKFLHVTTRRAILDEMDRMYPGMPAPDRAMMTWPRRFKSDSDVESLLFLDDLNTVLLTRVKASTRFSGGEKAACVSIASSILTTGKPTTYKVLRARFNIRPRHVRFFVDYVRVMLRSALYDIRNSLPRSFANAGIARVYGDE